MTEFSVLEYQYRDASGYKVFGELLIEGKFSYDDQQSLRKYMYDGEFFVPEEIGMPPLQSDIWNEFGGPDDDDHDWHSIENIRDVDDEDMKLPLWGTKESLFQKFISNRKRFANTPMDTFFPRE